MFENPEAFSPEQKGKEEEMKKSFETREGEKFVIEKLTSPEDPRVEKTHKLLIKELGEEEVDPIEVMRQSMTGKMEKTGEEVAPYLVNIAENEKGKVIGAYAGAVVETVSKEGEISEKSGVLLGCYAVVTPEMRKKGVWKELFRAQEEAAEQDAKDRGLKIIGFLAEAHDEVEPIFNRREIKRAYLKQTDGSFVELPYEQPPLDWDPKTGKPTEEAGTVPEHLMVKLTSGKNEISGEKLMEMVRGMYYYNNYRELAYFQNKKAYNAHTGFIEKIEEKLYSFVEGQTVQFLSREEREAIRAKGISFVEQQTK